MAPADQVQRAESLRALHKPGDPIFLYNVWDAASAGVIGAAGAQAVATGSWSVAAAFGYADGQQLPMDLLLSMAGRICASVTVPVSVDFEGGYARAVDQLENNIAALIKSGAVGLNFEDQMVGSEDLYGVSEQSNRLRAVRRAADKAGIPLVINARTDLFLKASSAAEHSDILPAAIERGQAYAEAGADCFFVPGLSDPALLERVVAEVPLPVNALSFGDNLDVLKGCGVARISMGPNPMRIALENFQTRFRTLSEQLQSYS
ncbi:MAG: isocitrate lyase/phosphoenolpyruvate mutase family protein [Pseudomonadota bacterium]